MALVKHTRGRCTVPGSHVVHGESCSVTEIVRRFTRVRVDGELLVPPVARVGRCFLQDPSVLRPRDRERGDDDPRAEGRRTNLLDCRLTCTGGTLWCVSGTIARLAAMIFLG